MTDNPISVAYDLSARSFEADADTAMAMARAAADADSAVRLVALVQAVRHWHQQQWGGWPSQELREERAKVGEPLDEDDPEMLLIDALTAYLGAAHTAVSLIEKFNE